MKTSVRVSQAIFKYFEKADDKFRKQIMKDLNKLQDSEIKDLIDDELIKKIDDLYYYDVSNNALIIFFVDGNKVAVIDYIFKKKDGMYSIFMQKTFVKNKETKEYVIKNNDEQDT